MKKRVDQYDRPLQFGWLGVMAGRSPIDPYSLGTMSKIGVVIVGAVR